MKMFGKIDRLENTALRHVRTALLSPRNCLEVTSAHAAGVELTPAESLNSPPMHPGACTCGPSPVPSIGLESIRKDSQRTPRLPRADLPAAGSRNKRRCRGRTPL